MVAESLCTALARVRQSLTRGLRRLFRFPSALPRFGRRRPPIERKRFAPRPPKPPWVRKEIIRLKALMPESGCRSIALVFNRRFAVSKRMTVGKTFVSQVIQEHRYEIQVLRRKLKHATPAPIPHNLVWGVDLTGKTDVQRQTLALLGIVEHRSRATLSVVALKDKTTVTILRHLLDAIERYGKPTILRTDNEAVFTSYLFRLAVWLIGIRHQRIDPHCPWQNGRIERFFGTLKQKLDRWEVAGKEELNGALQQFRFWYNHVRPHQNLQGRTPAEVWAGVDIFTRSPRREYWFEAWDGLLTGIYLKC